LRQNDKVLDSTTMPAYIPDGMIELNLAQAIPLTRGEDGVFRVSGTRVSLDSIVHEFKDGATPEQIQEDFPSVALSDIYSVVAYYLQHSRAVEDYLRAQTQAANEVRRELESRVDTRGLRERLRLRRAQATA
jgi:uncharacterized protein (DUF433 family)